MNEIELRELNTALCRKSNLYIIENAKLEQKVLELRQVLCDLVWTNDTVWQADRVIKVLEATKNE